MKAFDPFNLRVGIGSDLHQTQTGSGIILAGITIPCDYQLKGHSDADLILHAVTDALLGATAQGDIGTWFPDNNPDYAGANSAQLLNIVLERIFAQGYKVVNVDVIITCEKPKLTPYKLKMRERLAELLQIEIERVNIKAKTNEGCDAVGRMEAMSSLATVLIYQENI